jgi:hypothetical protein
MLMDNYHLQGEIIYRGEAAWGRFIAPTAHLSALFPFQISIQQFAYFG